MRWEGGSVHLAQGAEWEVGPGVSRMGPGAPEERVFTSVPLETIADLPLAERESDEVCLITFWGLEAPPWCSFQAHSLTRRGCRDSLLEATSP